MVKKIWCVFMPHGVLGKLICSVTATIKQTKSYVNQTNSNLIKAI